VNKGKIVQVMGPVVDVEFEDKNNLPYIRDALVVDNDGKGHMEVAQHLGDGKVRCIMLSASEGLYKGMPVLSTGGPISVPVGNRH
jgi:F-type H+-transporting ATPase subunit beta